MENLETPSTKEGLWKKEYASLETIVDACGTKIEEGIKDTLVALRLLGFNTTSSCAGHIDDLEENEAPSYPYVQIQALNRPKLRYENESEIRQELALKYNLELKDINLAIAGGWGNDPRSDQLEEIRDYFREIIRSKALSETADYKKWKEAGRLLDDKLIKYIQEFYTERAVRQKAKLELRQKCLSSDEKWKSDEENNIEKSLILQDIKDTQKEMQDFTEFLKKKYFEQK